MQQGGNPDKRWCTIRRTVRGYTHTTGKRIFQTINTAAAGTDTHDYRNSASACLVLGKTAC
ncbi:MAG: hypothetical protein H6R26_1066 [Proteobacteria bacterium]|nr:hypothetical protein [Pseudomonadota bacterium]